MNDNVALIYHSLNKFSKVLPFILRSSYFQVDHSECASMPAIFFSKYIIQISQTGIANVVFNHDICSARHKFTNSVCNVNSDTNTTLILGHVTGLQ